jgi:hypothetical protein
VIPTTFPCGTLSDGRGPVCEVVRTGPGSEPTWFLLLVVVLALVAVCVWCWRLGREWRTVERRSSLRPEGGPGGVRA